MENNKNFGLQSLALNVRVDQNVNSPVVNIVLPAKNKEVFSEYMDSKDAMALVVDIGAKVTLLANGLTKACKNRVVTVIGVHLHDSEREYSYLYEDEKPVKLGDMVVCPTRNGETCASVSRVVQCYANETPYPIEGMKVATLCDD